MVSAPSSTYSHSGLQSLLSSVTQAMSWEESIQNDVDTLENLNPDGSYRETTAQQLIDAQADFEERMKQAASMDADAQKIASTLQPIEEAYVKLPGQAGWDGWGMKFNGQQISTWDMWNAYATGDKSADFSIEGGFGPEIATWIAAHPGCGCSFTPNSWGGTLAGPIDGILAAIVGAEYGEPVNSDGASSHQFPSQYNSLNQAMTNAFG